MSSSRKYISPLLRSLKLLKMVNLKCWISLTKNLRLQSFSVPFIHINLVTCCANLLDRIPLQEGFLMENTKEGTVHIPADYSP